MKKTICIISLIMFSAVCFANGCGAGRGSCGGSSSGRIGTGGGAGRGEGAGKGLQDGTGPKEEFVDADGDGICDNNQ